MKFTKPFGAIWMMIVISAALSGCTTIKQYGFAAPDTEVRADGTAVIMPDNAPSISQGYRPIINEGLDIISNSGTPVIAVAAGTIEESYYESLYGNQIVIDHGKAENGMYIKSGYRHLEKLVVTKGDVVVRGQQIGTVGSSGAFAGCYPFVHYEVLAGDKPDTRLQKVNPHSYWAGGPGIVTCYDSGRQLPDIPFKATYPVPCIKPEKQ